MLQFVILLLQWFKVCIRWIVLRKFWFHEFDGRQLRVLRGGQPIEGYVAAESCRLSITSMKTMNFQYNIPSIPKTNDFKDHYVLVFDSTWMLDATETCHYTELVAEPLRLELNFNFPLEHVIELIVLGELLFSVRVDKFGVVRKNI